MAKRIAARARRRRPRIWRRRSRAAGVGERGGIEIETVWGECSRRG
jgi:hypothetical protein